MIKNKVKKGMILIYTDEYGNQKAIEPKDLRVKVNDETEISLGVLVDKFIKQEKELIDLKEEFYKFKSKQLQNTTDLLDNQTIQRDKLEKLSNEVTTLLSIKK